MSTQKELTVIDPKEYGLEESNVSKIVEAFQPKIAERNELVKAYEFVISQELTPQLAKEAKEVRLKLQKVRTGIASVHKTQKEYFLSAGRFVDAWKNKETLPVTQMEEKLEEIEKHYENIEKARIAKLVEKRRAELSEVYADAHLLDLATMPEEVYLSFLETKKKERLAAIKMEKQKEAERLKNERLDKKANDRRFELAPYAQFNTGNNDLRLMSAEDYASLFESLKTAKNEYDIEQQKIRVLSERKETLIKSGFSIDANGLYFVTDFKRLDTATILSLSDYDFNTVAKEGNREYLRFKAEEDAARFEAEKENKRIAKELQDKKDTEIAEAKKAELDKLAAEKEAAKLAKAPIKKQMNIWVESFSIPETSIDNETSKIIKEKFASFQYWAKSEIEKL